VSETLERLSAALADRYAVERELGRGGMSTVYLAGDLKHGRQVALKVLSRNVARILGSELFLREIRVSAGLSHPNILPLYDSGDADGLLYYVMPYVTGASLRERLEREKRLSIKEALHVAADIADALAYAHERGVVHCDVKPENILLEAGHAMLADFGVARALRAVGGLETSSPGHGMGTPAYMSPEAFAGERDLDGRSDLYSLACVLYELLGGQPPFVAATSPALAARHMFDEVPPLGTVRPEVPAHVVRAVTRALAKDPVDRWASMAEFADAFAAAPAPSPDAAKSIAVLPFANLSPDPEDEFLSDGITEEIITSLAKLQGLRVAARTSTFQYRHRGEDVSAIGERLGVGSVLEGSLRRDGRRLRVTAQLIDVASGYHLWSERYDREMADVFAIEDEIAQCIAQALEVVLGERAGPLPCRVPTADVRAYEYYLKGRQFFGQTRRKSLEYAAAMFERAIAIDPSYALAHAGLADCSSMLAMYYPPGEAELARADAASLRALEHAPDLAEAHEARGFALWIQKRTDEAVVEFETAIRLDPKQFEARYFYARLCFQKGETEKAARLFEEAASVREDYQARFFAAQSYVALGRAAEAEAAYRRAYAVAEDHLTLNPDDPRAATMCAVALCRTGQPEKGLACAEQAVAIDPEDAGVRYNVACLYALEGKLEEAITSLEEAFRHGFGNAEWIAHDPDLDSLRGDPRFQALLTAK
jgi:serine/threonine protein kinase/tetratricopeptide (TPR) repeat protein